MLGTNRTENALFVGAADTRIFDLTWEGLTAVMQRAFPNEDVGTIIADTWIAFARNGNPNNARLPEWLPYNLEARPVMVLDESPELVDDPRGSQRGLFAESDAYLRPYER